MASVCQQLLDRKDHTGQSGSNCKGLAIVQQVDAIY